MEERGISKPHISRTWQRLSWRSPAEEVEDRRLSVLELFPSDLVCSTFSYPTESKFGALNVHRECGACKSPDLRTRIQDRRSKSLGKSMSTTRAGAVNNTKASRS